MFATASLIAVLAQSPSVPPLVKAAVPQAPSLASSARVSKVSFLAPTSASVLALRMLGATVATAAGAAAGVGAGFGLFEATVGYRFPFGTLVCFPLLLIPTLAATMALGGLLAGLASSVGSSDFGKTLARAVPIALAVQAIVSLGVVLVGVALGSLVTAALVGIVVSGVATPLAVELAAAIERGHAERRAGVLLARFD